MTYNEQFHDASLRHQIDILRLGSGVTRKVNAILDETRADLRKQVERRLAKGTALDSGGMRRLAELERAIDQTRSGAWNDVTKEWTRTALDVATEEPLFVGGVLRNLLPVQLDLVMPGAATLRALATRRPFQGRLLKEWADSASRADLTRIKQQIRIGMVQGESARDIASRVFGVRGAMALTRHQAEAVTRTVINGVSNAAQQEFLAQNADLLEGEVFVATLDARTTLVCAGQDGKQYPVGKGPIPPLHVSCLPGDSQITTRGHVSGVSKRWFAGNVVVIRTASGCVLTCTPNHPVLTDRGWVPAQFVDESHCVVRDLGRQFVPGAEYERDERPATIEDISRAFSESSAMVRRRTPVAPKDFHGDVTNGEVEIVSADGSLGGEGEPPIFDLLLEQALQAGHMGFAPGSSTGPSGHGLVRGRLAGCAVSGLQHPSSLLIGGTGPALAHLLANGSALGGALPAQPAGVLHASANASGLEQQVDRRGAALLVLSHLLDRGPGEIAFDDVIGVSKEEFSGHVYNLATDSGHYTANGLIVHNCRSIRVGTIDGEVVGERPFKAGTEQQMLREYGEQHGIKGLKSRDDLPRGHKGEFDAFSRRRMRELTGQVPARRTYQEWLSRQPADIQDDILGPARGKLFREGGLTLDKFTSREGDELTLDQLRERNRAAWDRAGMGGTAPPREPDRRRPAPGPAPLPPPVAVPDPPRAPEAPPGPREPLSLRQALRESGTRLETTLDVSSRQQDAVARGLAKAAPTPGIVPRLRSLTITSKVGVSHDSLPERVGGDYTGTLSRLRVSTSDATNNLFLWRRTLDPASASLLGNTQNIAQDLAGVIEMTTVHEYAHHMHMSLGSGAVDDLIAAEFARSDRQLVSVYAGEDHREFWAESLTAYRYYPRSWLERRAPRTVAMVQRVLGLMGIE